MKWDPFKELSSLREDMERLFDSFLGRFPVMRSEGMWTPVVDIEENDDSIVVTAEIPGMSKQDIKITSTGNTLTITGERKREKEEKGKTYHRIERCYGKFVRSISLPVEVDPDRTKATYNDGLLKIVLPKPESKRPKEITIDVK
ncbi:MAG TPA: Hsp20/alpha crystallin family protein [bacterium (Candidatus Stahlbacteria)]|nr:Hsp20/alpha crystallin family protein [Candidatus Stahlbacteria bacterium]